MSSDLADTGHIDLSGQVAVVTGGGRGLGRAYALLLASRGARVVVNDLGADKAGGGGDIGVAEAVVAEIERAGGQALASSADIATELGGLAVIDSALAAFGRVDVLVHNAGFTYSAPFTDPFEDARRMFDVHLFAAWHVGQPAWRAMTAQEYGRIVLTSSTAIYGLAEQSVYTTVKAGIIGLTRALQAEADHKGLNVKVNSILPYAGTRLNPQVMNTDTDPWDGLAGPDEVAAVVAYLASRGCLLAGEAIVAGSTHVARVTSTQTRGWAKRQAGLTPEDVAEHLQAILDSEDSMAPAHVLEYIKATYELVMNKPAGAVFETTPEEFRTELSKLGG